MEQDIIKVPVGSANPVQKPETCPHCGYTGFRQDLLAIPYNPNGEYVEGYGHVPVTIMVSRGWRCISCSWSTNGDPTVLPSPH
jgi:hypothetical protein